MINIPHAIGHEADDAYGKDIIFSIRPEERRRDDFKRSRFDL